MPAAPYVALTDMKGWLDEKTADNDAKIRSAILVASSMIEAYCERDLISAAKAETLFGNGSKMLFPRRTPITAVVSCVVAGQAVPVTFHPEAITRTDGYSFDAHQPATVTFTAGYSPLPEDVIHAAKMTAQAVYVSPAYNQNFQSENMGGVFSGSYHQFGPGNIPPAARLLLERYRSRVG
jgi:hypothetical protein